MWNPATLATYFVFLLSNITSQGLSFFTPTIVSSIYTGRSVVSNQLYTVPPYMIGAFSLCLLLILADEQGVIWFYIFALCLSLCVDLHYF